jgi:hypothetical protein
MLYTIVKYYALVKILIKMFIKYYYLLKCLLNITVLPLVKILIKMFIKYHKCIIFYNCVQHLTFRVYWLAICRFSDCSYTVPDDEFNELETCTTLNIKIMVY